MKNKQNSLEDLDFLTELTISEQEGINGGSIPSEQEGINDGSINDFVLTPPEEPPILGAKKFPGTKPR